MALFKILRGKEENLPAQINSGWCYYTLDSNRFYIDTDQGRKCINDIPESLADLLDDASHRTVTDTQIAQWSQAQPNQNAFSSVVVGSTTLSADSTTDSLTLVAGTNVTLTPNADSDSVIVTAKDTTYTLSQDSKDGHKFTLTPSSGSPTTITIPDNDTTYTLSVSGNNLVFTPSSGSGTTITVPYATNAGTVNNHTVDADVPENAKFTDTVYEHPTSGVTAGTYRSVTVNKNGHVTAGSNPTTLAGYGITDALSSSLKGANNGLAELDSSGKVPATQLPSYVDDVLEYTSKSAFPAAGETGKIYVDQATNLTYRWSGSAYVEISPSLALGETSSTAYRGDRGKIAYDHSQATHARTDATKTESSSTNGNIKINGTETTVYTHPGSGTNPHGTTKSDVGLGNVGNFKAVSTVASQGLTDTEKSNARANIGAGTSSLTLGTSSSTAYRGDYGNTAYTHSQSAHARTDATKTEASSTNGNIKIDGTETTVYTHPGSGTNPHGTTKSDVGLGNVGNFKAVSTVASQGLTSTEQANARANIGAGTSSFSGSYNDLSNKPTLFSGSYTDLTNKPTLGTAASKDVASSGNASSTQVVMGNDSRLTDSRNAKDVYSWAKASTKPTYTASEVGAIASTLKGATNGVAELDANGKVPSTQLPSYVDDVLEYNGMSNFPTTGETGKIYVDTSTNKTYRWSGSAYTEISASLALGETSATAYRGDRGKIAYNHSQTTSGNPHNVTKSDVGLGNVGNFKAVSTVASQGLSATEQFNARANIGAGTSSFSGSYGDLSNKPTIPTKVSQLTNDSGYTTTSNRTYYGTCTTAAATKDKAVTISSDQNFKLEVGVVVYVKFTYTNSYSATSDNKITLNVNSTGAKNIYYANGYRTGTNTTAYGIANYYMNYMYNGTDWVWIGYSNDANTTYSVMSASEGTTGTATSARTMSAANLKAIIDARGYTTNTGTITGITMNGASKGTSGVVNLGTVITAHQDISGKADKSSTVSTVAWDSTNSKLTKTINGTTSDIVTGASILDGLTKSQVTTALGYTPPTTDTNTHYTSKNVVGATTATSNTTTALTNGNVYLNSVENGAVTSSHKISGSGSTTVTTDESGNIVINSTDTQRSVSDAVNSTSSTVAASSKAVKTAYDLAASKTANTGTVTKVSTGIGLTGGDITTTGTVKAKLKTETARTIDSLSADTSTTKLYPIVADKSGYLAVGVPWTDSDHITSATTSGSGNAVTAISADANGALTITKGTTFLTSHQDISGKANLASPAFSGTPTAPTAANGTNNTQIATTAFVMNAFTANDAMVFKGTIGSSGATVTALPATHYQGWTYKVITAGTYAGATCEIGDMIICITDGTSANDAHWTVVQSNIDGAVTGPASSVDARVAVFNGTSGKVIKDSGFTIAKSVPSNAVFTDTDTKVTAVGNHYTPSGGTTKSASGGTATNATGSGNAQQVVTGVTVDAAGHVTGVTSKGIYSTDTNTWRPVGTGASDAAAGNHTHSTSIATSSGTNQLTLAANTKYAITAGGTSYVFTTPPDTNTWRGISDAVNSTSSDVSASSKAVKTAYDLANGKADATHTHNYAASASAGGPANLLAGTYSGGGGQLTPSAVSGGQVKAAMMNNPKGLSGFPTYCDTILMDTYTGTDVPWTTGLGIAKQDASPRMFIFNGAKGNTTTWKNITEVVTTGNFSSQSLTKSQVTTALGYTPPTTDTNTTYSAGTGLSLSGTTFNHSNSITAQTTQAIYPIKIDAQGHISAYGSAVNPITSHQTIKQDGVTGATVNRFGTCSTAASTAAKVVSITTGTFTLEAGSTVAVKFTYANTANSPTLNVNSSGAKNIFVNGAQITSGGNKALLVGTIVFIYDGTQWNLIGNYYDTNTQTVTGVKGNSESSYRTGKVNITAANIGLGNVGNFKAVSTVASQGLTSTEQSNARANIGAGTSSLALGSTASTAAAGNHTHTLSIATSSGTNQITLKSGTKYQITAGGSTYVFTTPSDTTVDSFEECTSADIDEVFE